MGDTVDESIISLKIAGRTHGSIHNMFLENHVSKTRPCFCFWMQGVLSLVIPLLFWWMIYGTSAGRLEQSNRGLFCSSMSCK